MASLGIVERVYRQERRRRLLRRIAPIGMVPLGLLLAGLIGFAVRHRPAPRSAPPLAVPSTEIDFARVHAELLPAWINGEFEAAPDDAVKRLWADHHFQALRKAVAWDAALVGLVDRLREAAVDAARTQQAIFDLTDAWNARLRALAAPFLVETQVWTVDGRSHLYMNCYHVMAELRVLVPDAEGGGYQARFLERVDPLAGREHFLGRASRARDGALIIVDRVRDFAVEDLWPLLDEADDAGQPDGPRRSFAPLVRAEVRAGLPNASMGEAPFEILRRTAGTRAAVEALRETINQRALDCGEESRLSSIPWNGLTGEELDSLRANAAPDRVKCAFITDGELARLEAASRQLRAEPALESAVRALEAWATRGVAIHELRHVGDDDRNHGSDAPIACGDCPAAMNAAARLELSAYLASMSAPGVCMTALFQAQELFTLDDDGSDREPHMVALRFLLPRILDAGAPPKDLAARADALDRRLFGDRPASIALPAHYPARLPPPLRKRD